MSPRWGFQFAAMPTTRPVVTFVRNIRCWAPVNPIPCAKMLLKTGRHFISWIQMCNPLSRGNAAVLCGLAILIWSMLPARAQQGDSQQVYLQCLTNFDTYAQTIWHTSSTIPDSGYWGDGGSTGNGGIRGNSGIALAYAVLCIALPNDPQYSNRLSYVRQALNYDYNTHVTGSYDTTDGHQWGWSGDSTDWQTPEWSGSMGLACI